jgi:galactokinase
LFYIYEDTDPPEVRHVVDPQILASAFRARFGRPPRVFRAPGRINLLGEHTDYNGGFVMPMAIDRATWVAAAPRADRIVTARSIAYPDAAQIDLDVVAHRRTGRWTDYLAGIAAALDRSTRLTGADLLIASDVPVGAGLSSSAALETACGYALLTIAGTVVDRTRLALEAQRAEHEFVGTLCGIMDQFIACHARSGHALMLDTRDLTTTWLPLPASVRVLACNTMVRHELASAEYNDRRRECETAVRRLSELRPGIRSLRDVTAEDLARAGDLLPDRILRRCRHVISENQRVLDAAAALGAGDLAAFGRLMRASHASLRDDYEVSCRELDVMADIASATPGVYGARMTGGGFGGSVVALVNTDDAAAAAAAIACEYETATSVRPDVWVCAAADGVSEVPCG